MNTGQSSSGAKRDLVLGVIENYTFAQVEPFLLSLRQTGYAGDIVFFHHRVDPGSLEKIGQFGVRLIPFRSLRGAFPPGFRRKVANRLSRFYYYLKWPFYDRGWRLLLSGVKARYGFYHRFLMKEGNRYQRVLLTDIRDVVFQADPFSSGPTEDLLVFEESHVIGHEGHNAWWIRMQLGEETLARLAGRMTVCSGTIMGTPEALDGYLQRFLVVLRQAKRQDLPFGDQGVHNAVVHEGLADFPYSVRVCANGCAQVYTLTDRMETSEIRRSPTGEVVDPTGGPVPIIHQYDRHPAIQEALYRRIGIGSAPARI